tara:strand:+ start:3638 stop:3868 length:231 start_codon:yes stop_codon:yes gene_type:complete
MPKQIKILLDDSTYQSLMKLSEGNENSIRKWVEDFLNEKAKHKTPSEFSLNTKDLDSYLRESKPKNHGYGAKGQGW